MDPMKAAAKRRAMRKAGKEPGDMGEKPDRSPDEFVADPSVYMGSAPDTLRRQRRAININISGVDPDPMDPGEAGERDEPNADDTAAGVAKLHAEMQAAAKRRATRRTKR